MPFETKDTPTPPVLGTARDLRRFIEKAADKSSQCTQLAEKSLNVLRNIRKEGLEGVNQLNSFLRKNDIDVEAPHGAVFALNIILHVFVLFLALTVLYVTVISPLESKTLQSEVEDKLTEALQATWASAPPQAQDAIGAAMYVALPALGRAARVFSEPDKKREQNNKAVFTRAGLIAAFLGILFIIVASVLASCKVNLASHIKHILLENLLIFVIIGIVEYMFFMFVAKKFVPTMPSQLGSDALNAARDIFSTPFGGAPSSSK